MVCSHGQLRDTRQAAEGLLGAGHPVPVQRGRTGAREGDEGEVEPGVSLGGGAAGAGRCGLRGLLRCEVECCAQALGVPFPR